MSPRRPSSPHQFIHECQVQGRLRSSALIPVNSERTGSSGSTTVAALPPSEARLEASAQQQLSTPRAPPMSHPLFAGWGDTGLFASLLSKDVARLQRRLADMRRSSRAAGDIGVGRKDLADPMGCVRTLASMLLQPVAEACKQRSLSATVKSAGRRSGSDAEDPWRALCSELAERAAHLEVLLGVLAEVMVVQLLCLTPCASAGSAALADAAGCPSTRIGWVDEAIGALESLAARPATTAAGQPRARPEDSVTGAKGSASISISVQTVGDVRLTAAMLDVTTQTESVENACQAGADTAGLDGVVLQMECAVQAVQTELSMQDASTLTEPLEATVDQTSASISLVDAGTQAEPVLCAAAVQAASPTLDVCLQASVESSAAETQTAAAAQCVSSAMQTEPMAPPKPGGMRERKLNADDAIQQLAGAREKLKLEREAAAALETKLSAAGWMIGELQREGQALRSAAAASAEAAKAAAWRAPTVEASTQQAQELSEAEAQTDPAVFYTHSWQRRPDSASPKASCAAAIKTGIDEAVQTPSPPCTKSSSTQTWRQKQGSRDACVGGEEPLRLALGAADIPAQSPNEPWRGQYSQGMQALVEQWQGRWEEAEAERKRLAAIVGSGAAGNVGSAQPG